ncbi:MAG: ribosome maturation factor RimP [Lachnospiraceae bacterium]|nr:ribosome maturation factor RimP [Lachnospiraceae bacterium]MCD7840910.1 ribosome maturation factor RimP [Lachnospiraceae bacterium]
MSRRESYEQKTEELLLPLIEQNQFELIDVEYVKEGGSWYLRAYIDKPGGITIDDCELISRALSDLLDEHDFIEDAYILEVSSPGLGRPLKKDRDFERSIGEEVEIRTFRAIEHRKEFRGVLKEFDKNSVTIETDNKEAMLFQRTDIALIRLAFDF